MNMRNITLPCTRLLIVSLGFCLTGGTQPVGIPNAHLEVTVRQEEDGKLSDWLHIWELSCWDGACDLSILTLNQCTTGVGPADDVGRGFFPIVETFTTRDHSLRVVNFGDALDVKVTLLHLTGEGSMTARIGYRKRSPDLDFANVVTSFNGGAVKQSEILKKVITWELRALKGAWHRIPLDCPVVVEGVE